MKTVMKSPARSVRSLLSGDRGPLQRLVGHGHRLERVSALLPDLLPAPLNRHCRVANISDGILVIHTDAPIWTTRLRFHNPRLLADLRERLGAGALREIRLRTAPEPSAPVRRAELRTAILPDAAAAHLRAAAASIADPALRDALLRLAARAGS